MIESRLLSIRVIQLAGYTGGSQWYVQPPGGEALLNKPVIVAMDTVQSITFPIVHLLGIAVEWKARIERYDWHFAGDSVYTAHSPGRDCDSRIGGCDEDDCSAYINHTYTATGSVSIHPTLHWAVSYRVRGGQWEQLPAPIVVQGPARAIQIIPAHSVLTGD